MTPANSPSPSPPPAALLFDGDRIACLSAMLLKDLISQLPAGAGEGVRVGIIQTAYANGAASAYIREHLGCGVEVTPTGVKYLHEAAHRYDVGVYFEANGHGTVLFGKAFLERMRQVGRLSEGGRLGGKVEGFGGWGCCGGWHKTMHRLGWPTTF